jgi:hypothetical protein
MPTNGVAAGLKARHVTARPEGPGCETTQLSRGLKGRPHDCAARVLPLQGGDICLDTCSLAFSPRYHIAGFQPCFCDALKLPCPGEAYVFSLRRGTPISHRGNVNEMIGKFGGADQLRNARNCSPNRTHCALTGPMPARATN